MCILFKSFDIFSCRYIRCQFFDIIVYYYVLRFGRIMEYTLSNILDESIFTTPLDSFSKNAKQELCNYLKQYIIIIKNLKPDNPVSNKLVQHSGKLVELCDKLIWTLEAKDSFKDDYLFSSFNQHWESFNILSSELVANAIPQTLYRCRKIGMEKDKFEIADIYHPPKLPECKSKKGRYNEDNSICLYLGSSLFNCWNEIKSSSDPENPSNTEVIASRFIIHNQSLLKVIDLSFNYQNLAEGISHVLAKDYFNQVFINETIYCYISVYPIILSMSLHREYSISNQFLKWLQSKKNIDGIIYTSTYFYNKIRDYKLVKNYAFPVRNPNASGYDMRVKEFVRASKPLKLKEISLKSNSPYCEKSISSIIGDEKKYRNTSYGGWEDYLQKTPIEWPW